MAGLERGIVERFAFEVGRLAVEHDLVTDIEGGDPQTKRHVDAEELANAIMAAAEFASFHRPISTVGAMFQTMLAAADLDSLQSFVPEDKRTVQFRQMFKANERRLRGVIDYLERQSGVPLAQVGGDFYYGRDLDLFDRLDPSAPSSPLASTEPVGIAATIPVEAPTPRQPIFVSAEDQLLAYSARYEELEGLFHEVSDMEEARGERSFQKPDSASNHAIRMSHDLNNLINAVRATTIRELGLKARIAADRCGDWWMDGDLDQGELACKSLIEDILAAAGVAQLPKRDNSDDALRERARSGEWPSELPKTVHGFSGVNLEKAA